jgi:hypothetical protein
MATQAAIAVSAVSHGRRGFRLAKDVVSNASGYCLADQSIRLPKSIRLSAAWLAACSTEPSGSATVSGAEAASAEKHLVSVGVAVVVAAMESTGAPLSAKSCQRGRCWRAGCASCRSSVTPVRVDASSSTPQDMAVAMRPWHWRSWCDKRRFALAFARSALRV